jgi:hypothetical protein
VLTSGCLDAAMRCESVQNNSMSPVPSPPNGGRLYPPEVGELVRGGLTPAAAWRRHLGKTAEDVSNRAEMNPFSYRRMEELRHPSESDLWMLAAALGIRVSQLDAKRLLTALELVSDSPNAPTGASDKLPGPMRLRE